MLTTINISVENGENATFNEITVLLKIMKLNFKNHGQYFKKNWKYMKK